MLNIVWEFRVRAGAESEFERHYAADGAWAQLFSRGEGYRGTTLLRDREDTRRFVTIDVWDSHAHYERFKLQHAAEYGVLDRQFAGLTEDERLIGYFDGR